MNNTFEAFEAPLPPGHLEVFIGGVRYFRPMDAVEMAERDLISLEEVVPVLLDRLSKSLEHQLYLGIEYPQGSGSWYSLDDRTRTLASGILTNITAGIQTEPVPLVARDDQTGGFATTADFLDFYGNALRHFLTLSQTIGAKKDAVRSATTAQAAVAAFRGAP